MDIVKITVPQEVLLLCHVLQDVGYQSFMVGGCIRDQVLGLKPNDYDIATDCLPEEIMRIFKNKGFSVIPVGLKYGTVAVLVNGAAYEITTYRSEAAYTDGRHPDKVCFVKNLKEDLERRDFTINAMAYDPINDTLADYFNGINDIKSKVIKTVGDPKVRFNEDHLRILRAVRYAARFGYSIEAKTFEVMRMYAHKLEDISKERILSELIKMAEESGENFIKALNLLKEAGILKQILPEIDVMSDYTHDPVTHPEGGVWEHTLETLRQNKSCGALLNLAILFHDVGKPPTFTKDEGRIRYLCHHQAGSDLLVDIARRLKMSADLKEVLQFVALNHMKFHEIMDISNHKLMRMIESSYWPILYSTAKYDDMSRGDNFDSEYWQRIDERVADLKKKYIEQKKLDEIRKVVNGSFVMNIKGISPGPKLGEYIRLTIEWILDNSVDISDADRIKEFVRSLA